MALKARRDLYNSRPKSEDSLVELLPVLDGADEREARSLLTARQQLQHEEEAFASRYHEIWDASATRLYERLRTICEEDLPGTIPTPVALSLRELADGGRSGSVSPRLLRTAYHYLVTSVLKTTPGKATVTQRAKILVGDYPNPWLVCEGAPREPVTSVQTGTSTVAPDAPRTSMRLGATVSTWGGRLYALSPEKRAIVRCPKNVEDKIGPAALGRRRDLSFEEGTISPPELEASMVRNGFLDRVQARHEKHQLESSPVGSAGAATVKVDVGWWSRVERDLLELKTFMYAFSSGPELSAALNDLLSGHASIRMPVLQLYAMILDAIAAGSPVGNAIRAILLRGTPQPTDPSQLPHLCGVLRQRAQALSEVRTHETRSGIRLDLDGLAPSPSKYLAGSHEAHVQLSVPERCLVINNIYSGFGSMSRRLAYEWGEEIRHGAEDGGAWSDLAGVPAPESIGQFGRSAPLRRRLAWERASSSPVATHVGQIDFVKSAGGVQVLHGRDGQSLVPVNESRTAPEIFPELPRLLMHLGGQLPGQQPSWIFRSIGAEHQAGRTLLPRLYVGQVMVRRKGVLVPTGDFGDRHDSKPARYRRAVSLHAELGLPRLMMYKIARQFVDGEGPPKDRKPLLWDVSCPVSTEVLLGNLDATTGGEVLLEEMLPRPESDAAVMEAILDF
ncbi:hypothetical protein [uncultured Serinicoccus sp.]|uniref:hypothetical protein n=1 Tax=uncultured Serinicoccus sp. TaxID=735514 RepID=UPI0026258EB5|nr:hypothetical protein [uncultured Serinicoccus sp.]